MKFKELFTGKEPRPVVKARITIEQDVQKRENRVLGANRIKKLEAAEKLVEDNMNKVRRRVAVRVVCVLGAVGLGMRALLPTPTVDQPVQDQYADVRGASNQDGLQGFEGGDDPEADLDRMIDHIETSFKAFGEHLVPLIDVAFADDPQKPAMLAPFEIMQLNVDQNREKNILRMRKGIAPGGESTVQNANPYCFMYQVAQVKGSAAGFSPLEKLMIIGTDFDGINLLDQLVLYHELRHAGQDGEMRVVHMTNQSDKVAKIRYMRYRGFHKGGPGQKQRIDILNEASAYGPEIEAMDLLLRGGLRNAVENGTEFDFDQALMDLNARSNQRGLLGLIFELAEVYYPERASGGVYSTRFLDKIAQLHVNRGQEAWIKTAPGGNPKNWEMQWDPYRIKKAE